MKNLIYFLRENNKYYMVSIYGVILFFIVSAISTSVISFQLTYFLFVVGFFMGTYLMIFLGVNPIWKGILLTIISQVMTLIIFEIFDLYMANKAYQDWFIGERPRTSAHGIILFIVITIVLKVSKVKPYYKEFEKKIDDKEKK